MLCKFLLIRNLLPADQLRKFFFLHVCVLECRYDAAVAHDRDPLGNLDNLIQLVADKQNRQSLSLKAFDNRKEHIHFFTRQG